MPLGSVRLWLWLALAVALPVPIWLLGPGSVPALHLFELGAAAVDAVVLDLAMPDMSGEETFLRLRELRADLPVILVSGYDEARVADRFAARGLDAFLGEPWEPEELVAKVQQVLGR